MRVSPFLVGHQARQDPVLPCLNTHDAKALRCLHKHSRKTRFADRKAVFCRRATRHARRTGNASALPFHYLYTCTYVCVRVYKPVTFGQILLKRQVIGQSAQNNTYLFGRCGAFVKNSKKTQIFQKKVLTTCPGRDIICKVA